MCLLATGGAHAHGALEGVVDPPLEASECTCWLHRSEHAFAEMAGMKLRTNHEDTSTETLGREGHNTSLRGDLANTLALVLSLAEEGDERISGVGDNGADDTSEVTGSEGDTELGTLGV